MANIYGSESICVASPYENLERLLLGYNRDKRLYEALRQYIDDGRAHELLEMGVEKAYLTLQASLKNDEKRMEELNKEVDKLEKSKKKREKKKK